MSTSSFAVTWDYRCPFARNLHEFVLAGLDAGAPWRVRFVPFSLDQVHVEEGEPAIWGDPSKAAGLLALMVGVAVRDRFPAAFPRIHTAIFSARHDHDLDIREADILRQLLHAEGLDPDEVFAEIDSGRTLDACRAEHEWAFDEHQVFGVPTIIADDQAVFIRLMNRPGDACEDPRATVEHLLELLTGWTALNEFKHTSIPR